MSRWEGKLTKIDDYRWQIEKEYKPGMRVPGLIYADERMLKLIREEQALEHCIRHLEERQLRAQMRFEIESSEFREVEPGELEQTSARLSEIQQQRISNGWR